VTGITPPTGAPAVLYAGTTDVINLGYYSTAATPPNINGALIRDTGGTLNSNDDDATYRAAAMGLMFDAQRLWVNKHPDINTAAPLPAGLLAQMHPIIAENCSDFIVEFAGDYVDELPTGSVDGLPDGGPDVDAQGEIKWYGLGNHPASNSYAFPGSMPAWFTTAVPAIPSPMGTSGGKVIYVFRHDQPHQWPYLVRIRYRLHDKRGDLQGSFSPEDEVPPDPNNDNKIGTNYGRWFEQIIRVNR
jgi:hypothetical protein